MIYVAVAAGVVGGIGMGSGVAPALTAVLALTLSAAMVAWGLARAARRQGRRRLGAWALLGGGVLAATGTAVLGALGDGLPTTPGPALVLDLLGAGLTVAGLVQLIGSRRPGRGLDAVTEAVVLSAALGLVVLATAVLPRLGWHPGRQLAALGPPLLDVVILWLLAVWLVSGDRRGGAERALTVGCVVVGVAHAVAGALALGAAGGSRWSATVEAALLCGTGVWALAFVLPSPGAVADPVPARTTRPGALRVGLVVGAAVVVPAALSIRSALGAAPRQRDLVVASTFLPLVVLLYLLRQVFTHAAAEYRAQHDPLTGVCNRLLFEDRLRQALGQARRSGTSVAVMFLDLDRFKEINDRLGHAAGNELLRAVVQRLQGALRQQDTLARMGGDEFTLIIPDALHEGDSVLGFAERILDRFTDPFSVGADRLTVRASIGVAVSPDDGEDVATLLEHADSAMYRAKSAGRNTVEIFDTALSARARMRTALEGALRAAVEGGRLAVHYQPKLEIATGAITGVEALARWEHPGLGFIPPSAFIAVAEESNLVARVGQWVLEEACHQARCWHDAGLAVPVAVNVSPRQFGYQPVAATVRAALGRAHLDPALLEIEMTESVLVEHVGDVAGTLGELRALGVRCSIDDFGTGYSALTYLAELPVDAIKIDRSFVARIEAERGGAVVGAVVALAHSLGLAVVAEGVETDGQLRFLEASGCDQVQGYRFSPPVPAAEMTELLRSPALLFTGWRHDLSALAAPGDGVTPCLEALLGAVGSVRHGAPVPDDAVVAAVLAALAPEQHRHARTRGRRPPLNGAGTTIPAPPRPDRAGPAAPVPAPPPPH
ncbi:MAG TPA: EAL domain-containing protein [Acidimicrobiales bacterium]|nr:EAL domain-containing protein [Acidimicrobiales bacterium]